LKKRVTLIVALLLLISSISLAYDKIDIVPDNDIKPGDSFAFVNPADALDMTTYLNSALLNKGYQVAEPNTAKFICNYKYKYIYAYGANVVTKFSINIINKDKRVVGTVIYESLGTFNFLNFSDHIIRVLVKKIDKVNGGSDNE
jgi:hypothetical protein